MQASQTTDPSIDPTAEFQGEFISTYNENHINEPFIDISLSVSETANSLEELLRNYFDDSNAVKISKFPETLIIDLKRFYFNTSFNTVNKVTLVVVSC